MERAAPATQRQRGGGRGVKGGYGCLCELMATEFMTYGQVIATVLFSPKTVSPEKSSIEQFGVNYVAGIELLHTKAATCSGVKSVRSYSARVESGRKFDEGHCRSSENLSVCLMSIDRIGAVM